MKKLFVIVFFFLGVTACHKADIRPNCPAQEEEPASFVTKACESGGNANANNSEVTSPSNNASEGTAVINGTGSTSSTDDNGSITDPLRKKSQKDNK